MTFKKEKPKAIIFGSGNIGRGLIPEVLANKYEICFVDLEKEKVKQINSQVKYKIIHFPKENNSHFQVKDFSAFLINRDDQEIKRKINEAKLIFTAVGKNNLKFVAKYLATSISKNSSIKTIISCENANKASAILEKYYLNFKGCIDKNIQFVNSIIDRIVPNDIFNPREIYTEKKFSIILSKKDIHFNIPMENIEIKLNFDKYIFRKFFLLNATHTYISWMGIDKKYVYIHQAVQDRNILRDAKMLGKELIEVITSKFYLEKKDLENYFRDILKRFKEAFLKDSCKRVGKFVLRKLSFDDRFLLPYRIARSKNINVPFLKKAIILGLNIKNDLDPETKKRDQIIVNNKNYLKKITGLDKI